MDLIEYIRPVNLDGFIDDAELRQLGHAWRTLSEYAFQRATAIALRKIGTSPRQIEAAEKRCEELYREIPKDLRW